MEDKNIHDVIHASLYRGSVRAAHLVAPLDGLVRPIRPVDEVAELGETERVRLANGVCDEATVVATCRTKRHTVCLKSEVSLSQKDIFKISKIEGL